MISPEEIKEQDRRSSVPESTVDFTDMNCYCSYHRNFFH